MIFEIPAFANIAWTAGGISTFVLIARIFTRITWTSRQNFIYKAKGVTVKHRSLTLPTVVIIISILYLIAYHHIN